MVIRINLKIFLAALTLTLISSCATPKQKLKPEIWLSDAENGGIKRNGLQISCESVTFRDYICVHENQFQKINDLCIEAQEKKWWAFWR